MNERIQKFLARRGICSRRAAEKLIAEGLISVNGAVVTELGSRVDPDQDDVTVDGEPVPKELRRKILMLNKPVGYLSTCKIGREKGASFLDLVPDDRRYFPVGRLDRDSTGLLLITDDGELAYALTHPKFGCEKTYTVETSPPLTDIQLRKIRTGIPLDDGRAFALHVQRSGKKAVRLTLREGRKREIRRMMEALGVRVLHLHRNTFAGLELGTLRPGRWRELKPVELEQLRTLIQSSRSR
ncbi:rRNA pseudouridine synthase [bacterium]|nr:rRNA pseudouridine synthase [bacterium]